MTGTKQTLSRHLAHVQKIEGDEISLELAMITPRDERRGIVPAYRFQIIRAKDREVVGAVSLRVGDNEYLRKYAGHIGYRVYTPYRGHKYAGKAVKLLRDLARANGFTELWITTNPDNIPSRKTCEWIGAQYIEEVPVPENTALYKRGDVRKSRYLLRL